MRTRTQGIDQKRQHPNVSVKALLKWKNKILMLRHSDGSFDFPGGRVKFREELLVALRRELKEELSIELEGRVTLFDVWNYISTNNKRHSVLIYYISELVKKPVIVAEKEVKALWLTKNEFFEKNVIRDPRFLDKIFRWQVIPDENLNTTPYWNSVYQKEMKTGGVLEEEYHRNYQNVFKKIVNLIPERSRVLDVGCGPGVFCRMLKEKKPSTGVTGIDFSAYIIRENAQRDASLGITYVRGDIKKKLPFRKRFDVLVMTEVLEHLERPTEVLDRLMRHLKKDGLFFLSCPHDNDVEHWIHKLRAVGEHMRIWTHDDVFHLLTRYSDEIRFIELPPVKKGWMSWHILAYFAKTKK